MMRRDKMRGDRTGRREINVDRTSRHEMRRDKIRKDRKGQEDIWHEWTRQDKSA